MGLAKRKPYDKLALTAFSRGKPLQRRFCHERHSREVYETFAKMNHPTILSEYQN
jgi:hypothetical protein